MDKIHIILFSLMILYSAQFVYAQNDHDFNDATQIFSKSMHDDLALIDSSSATHKQNQPDINMVYQTLKDVWNWFSNSIPIFVGTGGVLSALVFIYDRLAKKREESVSMSKYRMDRLEKMMSNYSQIYSTAYEIGQNLTKYSTKSYQEKIEVFLSLLKFTQSSNSIMKNGNFLLTDQDAESVLSDLTKQCLRTINNDIFNTEYSKFLLLQSDKPLHDIMSEINFTGTQYRARFNDFENWILNTNSDKATISKMAGCISDLLLFELNIAYKDWYAGKRFKAKDFLIEESKTYLFNEHIIQSAYVKHEKGNIKKFAPKYYKKLRYNNKLSRFILFLVPYRS